MIQTQSAKKNKKLITMLFSAIFTVILISNLYAEKTPELTIDESFYTSSVNGYISFYEDKTGLLSIKDISKDMDKYAFKKFSAEKHNIGYSKSTYWLKINTINPTNNKFKWLLESSYPSLDSIILFTKKNKSFIKIESGDSIQFSKQLIKYRKHVFPLLEESGQNVRFIKIKSSGSLIIDLHAYSPEAFNNMRNSELPLLWLYYGIMFALMIYNLFIYFSFKDITYIYISMFIFSITIFSMIYNGIACEYLWPDSSWWANHSNPFFIYLACISTMLFSRSFLNLKENIPVINSIINFMLTGYCAGIISLFFMDYYYSSQMSVIAIFATAVLCMLSGIISAIMKVRSSVFFLITWTTFLIGAGLVSLMINSIISNNFLSNWWYQIGSTITAFLLPLGLTSRISQLQKQREDAVTAVNFTEKKIVKQYKKFDAVNEELKNTHNNLIEANIKINIEKEQLSATLSSIGDAVIAYDKDEKIIFLNHVAETLTGWKRTESLGKNIREIVKISDKKSSDYLFDNLIQYNSKNSINLIEFPFTLIDKNGNQHIIEVNSSMISYQPEPNGDIVLAIRDITEKHRLEKEIHKMNRIESLGILAGGMAHDFNNLLTAIIGNISIAKNLTNIQPELDIILDKIDQAGKRAISLTRQILTFSKGGAPVKKISNIPELLYESSTLLLTGSNVSCNIKIEENLWSSEIDVDQISQVFNNIIINAVQAMKDGGIININAKNLHTAPSNLPLPVDRYLLISISDNGIGIPANKINKIFDPFFTTKENGTGLGLASSYSILKKHGGHIEVESELDIRTTFKIYLPAIDKKPRQEEVIESIKKIHEGNILLMDDEKYIIDVAQRMMSHLGYIVDSAPNGEEAIEKYKKAFNDKNPFHAVIVDLTVPGGMGGKETIKKLLEFDPDVTAIVSSGYSDDPVMSNFKSYGFKDLLIKPYRIDDIQRVLNNAISSD